MDSGRQDTKSALRSTRRQIQIPTAQAGPLVTRTTKRSCSVSPPRGLSDHGSGASAVITQWLCMLWSAHHLPLIQHTGCFPDCITPASPVDAKPVIPFDAGLRFKLESSERRSAVGRCSAFDFLKNVQFGHRHSFPEFLALACMGGQILLLFVLMRYMLSKGFELGGDDYLKIAG